MLKVKPVEDYPPEEGHYLRGNDFSPVAVVVILTYDYDKIPVEIENLARLGVESGAALSGTLQTENIGIEKIVCNIIANPNIRYIVICGPESKGHLTGEALISLVKNGVDERKRIIGTESPTPYLFNLPKEYIERFRKQIVTAVNLLYATDEIIREAIRCCYQEKSTKFQDYTLYDIGAYPEPLISGKLTWRVTHPEREPKTEEERNQRDKLKERMEWIKKKVVEKEGKEINKKRTLFLCTGNSARSQMAEGLLRHWASDKFEVFSAGINPTQVNPIAIRVMNEIGIDISKQRSKSVKEFLGQRFDYVITVCDNARKSCPVFPGKYQKIHWDLQDPAQVQGTDDEKLLIFRNVRNLIKENILKFLNLPKDKAKLRCPHCDYIQEIDIPQNSCLHLYECKACRRIIKPTEGSCCVICAYSDKNCPAFG